MKFFKFTFTISLLFIFFATAFPQSNADSATSEENNAALALNKSRIAKLKADILQEIQPLGRKEQARYYAQLGGILWEQDQKEALFWLTKAIDLGLNSANEYKNDSEKLSAYWNLLHNVLEKDEALTDKVIAQIRAIRIEESNTEVLEAANKTYLLIAEQIIHRKGDEKPALEFGLLSLKGKSPAINHHSVRLLLYLENKNESSADIYFYQLLEAAKNTGKAGSVVAYLFDGNFDSISEIWRRKMPESKIRAILELMLPAIQKDAEAVRLKKRADCSIVKSWGVRNLSKYKQLLPEKFPIVEQAVAACQNSDIPAWKKPDFSLRPQNTSQDLLNLVKEIGEKKIQANYLKTAVSLARAEKNYKLANEILDDIVEEFRDWYWDSLKISCAAEQISELLRKDELPEIETVLAELSPKHQPYAISASLFSFFGLKITAEKKLFIANLLKRAENDFKKIDKFPDEPQIFIFNPAKFSQLTLHYVNLGLYDQAIATHEESIKSLNRLMNNLPPERRSKIYWGMIFYSTFTNSSPSRDTEFVNQYYDRIRANIGKIENPPMRLSQHLNLLRNCIARAADKNLKIPVYRL